MGVFVLSEKRFYSFAGVSYAESEQLFSRMAQHDVIRAWSSLHDNDLLEDGTIKKPHTHFVCVTKSAHTVSAFRKWFKGLSVDDIDQNTLAQGCETVQGACRYLLHLDDLNKVKYSLDHVKFFNDSSERYFIDYCRNDNGAERQFEVVLAYANGEINLVDAMKRAPELFIHKYISMQKLCADLRRYNTIKNFGGIEDED